jgi:NADPH-dependent glutamate synthase beta subunit-like oxidoreductase
MASSSRDTCILQINGKEIIAKSGMTVLETALNAGIYVPHLCYHPDLSPSGACRLCVVQIEGKRGLLTACTTQVENGMKVHTDSSEINKMRRGTLQLLLANHPTDCLTCRANLQCDLQFLSAYLDITKQPFRKLDQKLPVDKGDPLFIRDYNKCILCGRCIQICQGIQKIGVLSFINRGSETIVGTAFDKPLTEADCKFCLACVEVCPTGALFDRDLNLKNWSDRKAALIPCKYACPAEIDVPRYINLVAMGKYHEAVAVIREKVPFPGVLGRICTHPCEVVCRREKLNEPIDIKNIKRFAADHDDGFWRLKQQVSPSTGKKVAIVGSGPAGLTVAYFLVRLGHSVTVFEKLPQPGGMMLTGIPEFRLPREVLAKEIDEIIQLGVQMKLNTRIDSLTALFREGYDAIFVAVGAHQSRRMYIAGEDSPEVIDCVSFLREVSLGKKMILGEKVAVIGGGNAAIDAACTSIRLGVKEVTIIYRRTRVEMPASTEEVDEALQEGVNIQFLATPVSIKSKDGIVKVKCVRMKLGEPDMTGRRRPTPIQGSEFTMDFNTVIVAISQMPEIPAEFGLTVDKYSRVKVDPTTLETNRKGVFAGGDAVSGPASVIEAIASGRKAAISIDRYLGGKGTIDQPLIPVVQEIPCIEYMNAFASLPREKINTLPIEKRHNSYEEVNLGFNEETVIKEAKRCLKCNLRFQISTSPLPPLKIIGSAR